MLAPFYRFRLRWDGDQTLTYNNDARLDLSLIPWKLASGALSYGTEISDNMGFTTGSTLADEGQTESSVIDNTSTKYLGLKGTFKAVADVTSTDGYMYLYIEESPDNTLWPSDEADFDITDLVLVAVLPLSTTSTDQGRAVNFEVVA